MWREMTRGWALVSLGLLWLCTGCQTEHADGPLRMADGKPVFGATPEAATIGKVNPPATPETAPKADPEIPDASDDPCLTGPKKTAASESKVYYGTKLPTHVPLTQGQVWAVGTFGWCSGTLVAPRWVLSASHCQFWTGVKFCMGKHASNPNHCVKSVEIHDHPWADLSLVKLSKDARDVFPGVEPIPLMHEDLGPQWIGVLAEAGGYGQQEDGSSGEREFTAEPIVYLGNSTMTIDGEGKHGVCFGDSGGPVMVVASDGTVRAAGNLANGDSSCLGKDNYTRVDVFRDWILQRTGPIWTPGPQPCGDHTGVGKCNKDATRATYCGADDILVVETCGAGDVCSWDASAEGWRCIDEDDDPCKGVGYWGECKDNVLKWCGAGGLQTRDCGACGETCVPNDTWGYFCVSSTCGDLTFHGQCEGDVVRWCNRTGEPETRDCAAQGEKCGWSGEHGYDCIPVDACGGLTYHGVCEGSISRWCEDGKAKSYDCAWADQECGWVNDEKGYACLPKAPCGDLTYAGTCEGDVARWCGDDGVEVKDCAAHGEVCGWVDDSTGYYCHKETACGSIDYHGTCDGDVVKWCDSGELKTTDCAETGNTCGWTGQQKGYYCVAPNACGDLTYEGKCEGTQALWCDENGESQSVDCSAQGLSCGYVDASVGYYCHE